MLRVHSQLLSEEICLRPGLPNPDTFRSCRSSRLQRFTPRGTV